MMENQQTLFIIKPDAIERGLIGELIARLERKGLRIVRMEMRTLDRATAEKLYASHVLVLKVHLLPPYLHFLPHPHDLHA